MNYKFSPETNFKQTEMGEIPKDWDVVRLGEVIFPDRIKISWRDYDGKIAIIEKIPFNSGRIYLRSKNITRTDLYISGDKAKIVTSKINFHQGAIALLENRIAATTHYEFYALKENRVLSHYIWWYLRSESFKNIFEREIRFRGFKKEANYKFIQNFPIPLPPLSEQKAIADVLSTIQEAKEQTEAVIKATRELKKSMMKHLFTYGPVPMDEVDKVKLKETEIGLIPEDWDVVRLGEVIEKTNQSDIQKKSDWKFKYIDVSCIDNILLKIVTHQVFTGKTAPSRARKVIKIGDVIFATVRPYLKRIAIVSQEFDNQICSTAFCVLRPKSNLIDGNYLFFVVSRDEFVSSVSEHQRGSSYPAITDNDVKNGFIPLPPLPVQQKIAEILKSIDEKIEKEEAKKKALENLFKSMLHNLMSGKLRVRRVESGELRVESL